MSTIEFTAPHQLSIDALRARIAQELDRAMAQYGLTSEWRGDRVDVRATGAKGSIELREREVSVSVALGLLLRPLRGKIEDELRRLVARAVAAGR